MAARTHVQQKKVLGLTHGQLVQAAEAACCRLGFVSMLEEQLLVCAGVLLAGSFCADVLQQLRPKLALNSRHKGCHSCSKT